MAVVAVDSRWWEYKSNTVGAVLECRSGRCGRQRGSVLGRDFCAWASSVGSGLRSSQGAGSTHACVWTLLRIAADMDPSALLCDCTGRAAVVGLHHSGAGEVVRLPGFPLPRPHVAVPSQVLPVLGQGRLRGMGPSFACFGAAEGLGHPKHRQYSFDGPQG